MKTNRLLAIAMALVASLLVVVPATASNVQAQTPVNPTPGLSLSKQAPTEVLAGDAVTFTLEASNSGPGPAYNLSFRDVLPLGVTYAGPTAPLPPSGPGEPRVETNKVESPAGSGNMVDQQTLIWENVSDLQANDSFSLSFPVDLNETPSLGLPTYPVGSTVSNTGEVYGSKDARVVPTFTSTGEPVANPEFVGSVSATTDPATQLTAIKITKFEPSDEGELLRGVHDFTTVYTLTVDVTDTGNVNGATVTDFIPASLEFLGCGGDDNGIGDGGNPIDEYPGSGPLGGAAAGAFCRDPQSVQTVSIPDPSIDSPATLPPGTYTKVTWQLGDLATGSTTVLTYAAGIPMFENTLDFEDVNGDPLPTPSPESAQQGSNLDNNNGTSTREGGTERAAINVAVAAGSFDGPIEDGASRDVESVDRLSRSIEDVRLLKSASTTTFDTGEGVTYTLQVDVSEYVDASGIELGDLIPNGLCPIDTTTNYVPGDPVCAPNPAAGPTVVVTDALGVAGPPVPLPYTDVEQVGSGAFDVTFLPISSLTSGESATVTYVAGMRSTYGGTAAGPPTVSGDSFTNVADLSATTDVIAGSPEPSGPIEVGDGSQTTIGTEGPEIEKLLLPRSVLLDPTDPTPCPTDPALYVKPTDEDDPRVQFRLGDNVCFLLEVNFPDTVQTKNADVGDFLPVGVDYVDGSMTPADDNTIPPDQLGFTTTDPRAPIGWLLGAPPNSADRFVATGAVFQVVLAGEVTSAPDSDSPQLKGNLMKMRTVNTAGAANSFRDDVPFRIVPAPPIQLIKGVERVDTPSAGPFLENTDEQGQFVQQGSNATFRIDLTNLGKPDDFNDFSVRNLDVLDVLPSQLSCDDIVPGSILNFGTDPSIGECFDPADPGYPIAGGSQSVIQWDLDGTDPYGLYPDVATIPPGAEAGTRSLFYTVRFPSGTTVDQVFTNDAGVRSYGAFTNTTNDISPDYFPEDNIDPNVPNTPTSAPPARDTSFVQTREAAVSKFVTSWIEQPNNNRSNPAPPETVAPFSIVGDSAQAVVGEYVTFRYFVDIPAQTTVFNAALTDQLPPPNNGEFVIVPNPPAASGAPAASAGFYAVAGTGSPAALPSGFTFTATDGSLTFPLTYNNNTATAQRFEVVVSARVADTGLGVTNQPTRTNTASFTSKATLGGVDLDEVDDTAAVQIRQPVPSLTKVATEPNGDPLPAENVVAAGQTVLYTLTASNEAGRPPLHDTWLVDCVPDGLESVAIVAPQTGDLSEPGNPATNGCETTETYVQFNIGSLAGGASAARQYTAVVSTESVGGQVYPNTATLTGSSLDNGKPTPQAPDDPNERVYDVTADESVRVLGAGLLKTVTPQQATIGEDVEFTLRVVVPANTNFYQAAVVDRLPLGYALASPLAPTVTCNFLGTTDPCGSLDLLGVLGPEDDLTPSDPTLDPAQVIAFSFGDVRSDPQVRVVTITYTATVADIVANVDNVDLVNTAQARWDLVDSATNPDSPLYPWTASGNPDDASVEILEPRLTIQKTTPDLTIEPGQEFDYSIVVTNTGRSTAFNTVITDTIPAGIVLVPSATSPDQGGVVSGQTITWNIPSGSLDPTESVTLTYRARLVPSAGISASTPEASFRNNARVTGYTSLPDAADPDGREYTGPSSNVTVTPQFPRLTTAKSRITASPAYIGSPVTWEIATTNAGPGTASTTTISDTLPPNWTFGSTTSITGPAGAITPVPAPTVTPSPSGDQLTWALGTLTAGQSYTVRFTATPQAGVATTPPGLPATFTNRTTSTAKDTSGATGNAAGEYTASATATARIDRVDLAIDKSHTAAPIAGENFSWSIVVRNLGPSTAVANAANPFTVTDTIPTSPAGVTYVGASGDGWTCPAPVGGVVTCTRTGSLSANPASNSLPPITFTVRIPSDTPDGTRIANTASVGGQRTYESPNDLANNTDTDEAIITTRADLELVKTLDAPLVAGQPADYTLVVTNKGPSTSRATVDRPIRLVDTLPAGTTFVSASPGCTHDAGIVTCLRTTDLALDATWTTTIKIQLPTSASGSYTNTGVVTPDITVDPIVGNNTSSVIADVGQSADLGIVKDHTGPSIAGEPTTFSLKVTNYGPSDAATVTIVDTLPAGLTYRGFSNVTGNWTCSVTTAPEFQCDLLPSSLPLAPTTTANPRTVEVSIEVDTAANLTGQTRINEATVSSTTPDPNQDTAPGNNTDDASVTFAGVADLTIGKTAAAPTVVPGADITWTVTVENLGPSDSLDPITVTDALPPGMTAFVSAAGVVAADDWDCAATTDDLVTCVKGTPLAAGDTSELTIVGTVDPDVATPAITAISNTAIVTPTTDQGVNAAPDTATNVVDIVEPDVSITKRVDNLTPQPGDPLGYTIELSNTDVADAFALVVTDDIPAGIAVDPASISNGGRLTGTTGVLAPDGVTTVQVGGTITWNIATLARNTTLALTYSATLAPSSTLGDDEIADGITNTASLESYSSLPTGGRPYTGGEASATVTPRFPKLAIAKEALGDVPTYIGSEFGWRITVTNVGDGDASVVSLVDTLPTNWEFVDGSAVVTAPGPVGTIQPGVDSVSPPLVETLTWADLGPLGVGQSLTVTIRSTPTTAVAGDPGVGRSIEQTNTAEANAEDATGATGNGATPDGGSYGSGETTAVAFIDAADVVVVKGNTAPSAIAGKEYRWTIDVRNDGPDTAVGPFVVTDTLPALTPEPLTFVRAVGDGWACTETSLVVTCRRIDTTQTLASGDGFPTITVTVRVPSDYLAPPAPEMSNTATVSSRTYDPDTANNTSTVTTPVSGEADLRIVKRRGAEQIIAGQPLTYFLDVTNLGPSTARADITVTDTLPPEVTFRDAPTSADGDPWDCVFAPDGALPTGGTVTCTLVGTPGGALLANQAAPQIPILVDVVSGAKPDTEIVNTAVVASPTFDPDTSNNTSENRGRPDVSADLAIDKNATGRLVAGSNATYRMVVVNNGPSDAENVRIVDDLPAGLTYVGFANDTGTWNCPTAVGATSFRCDLTGDLVAGDSASVDIVVAVASGVLETIVNFATVESDTFDPVPENNTDGDTSVFGTIADLAIQKTNTGSPVKAGENATWNLVVTNNGPSDSQPVISVVDSLPASVEFVSATGDGWVCTNAPSTIASFSSVVTCTRAAALTARQGVDDVDDNHIAPPIVLVARVLPGSGPGAIVNSAIVLPGTTDDGNPRNNFDDDEILVIDEVDVSIVKTANPTTVTAGTTTTFTLQVSNAGPSTADNIVVNDVVPSGLTIESLDAPGWTCPLSTTVEFRCELPTLAPGDAPPITVVARVGSGVPAGTLTNTGRVTTTSPDRNPQNNADDAVITIVTDADLGITKVHPADPIVAGGDIEFEMRVVNNGPSDALAVVIEDRMPAGFSYVSSRGPWDCELTSSDPDVVRCAYLPGRLIGGTPAAPTAAEPLFITAAIDSTLDTGTYVNVAEVSSDTPDSNPDNDIAEDPVFVGTLADLTITKTHPADAVRIGEELVFTLQVRYFGPSEARDVVVTDAIPAGLTLVSAAGAGTPSTWDCAATVAPDVDCRLTGPLAAGADAEPILVTVLVTPAAFPSVSNTAVVASATPEPDPDPNPNTSTDVVGVPRLIDLFITKSHAGPVAVGQPIVYTLTVGNNGPIDDDAVITVTDPIPASLRATAATSAAAECRISDNVVTCTKDDGLAVGATFTVTVTADVLPAAYPSVTNTATVSSPTDDSNPLNNTASDVATVPPLVDLAITKTHAGEVQVGGRITYTVTVRNNGPTPDPGPVRMLDTLPGSLTPVSATAEGMTCTITGQTVACQALAPLAVGAQLVVTIVADVGPAAFPSVSNTAIVTTPGCVVGPAARDAACPDTNLDNNTATDVATVAPLVLLGVQKTLASLEASTATWSIVVTNLGSNATVDPIRMTDNLPNTLAYVSAAGDGWLCTNFGQTVGCTYSAPLAPGASAPPISVVTLVNAPAGTSITNVATVDGGGPGVPSVTDDSNVIAPVRPPLPTTGGGPGVVLQWAPLLMLLGLGMVLVAKRRRTNHAS